MGGSRFWSRCRGWRRKQLGPAGVRFQLGCHPSCCELRHVLAHSGSLGSTGPGCHSQGPCAWVSLQGQEAWTLLVISVRSGSLGWAGAQAGPVRLQGRAVLKHPHTQETHHTRRDHASGNLCDASIGSCQGQTWGDSSEFQVAQCTLPSRPSCLHSASLVGSFKCWFLGRKLGCVSLLWPSLLSTTLLSTTQTTEIHFWRLEFQDERRQGSWFLLLGISPLLVDGHLLPASTLSLFAVSAYVLFSFSY